MQLQRFYVFFQFQSTLPVWGATDVVERNQAYYTISIHAPRVGSDGERHRRCRFCRHFNPRSPCGERPHLHQSTQQSCQISIHAPRVGSDFRPELVWVYGNDFNPRSPCGERQALPHLPSLAINFNPRSPCGERHFAFTYTAHYSIFQSTLPVWGATYQGTPAVYPR